MPRIGSTGGASIRGFGLFGTVAAPGGAGGGLWSWGRNDFGQLGLGNITNYSSPMQVGALITWATVAGGSNFSLALKTDGTLWSWGLNTYGQLGLGDVTNRSSPNQIGTLTTWSKLGLGVETNSSLAIKTDGTLWSWGQNNFGQLGLGNTTNYSSPKQVGALTTWATVAGLQRSAVAVKTDGTLWSWGRNANGQLGLGNTTGYSSPVQVGALTTWSKSSGGQDFALAIKTDGTLWSWGRNDNGQLGLGNTTDYSSPVQVGALTNWFAVSPLLNGATLAIQT